MHYFKNFKGFADARLDLLQPLIVLIGPNGSGKSNVIEGVELLSFVAQGRPLYEVVEAVQGGAGLQIRGGLQGCPMFGTNAFTIGFSTDMWFEGENRRLLYEVSVGGVPESKITSEKLAFHGGPMIFETVEADKRTASGDVVVRYNNFARGGKKPQVPVSAGRSVLSQYIHFVKSHSKIRQCDRLVQSLTGYLRSSFVFNPIPEQMRRYVRLGGGSLLKDGSNLSAVLYQLTRNGPRGDGAPNRLLGWIKQLPEEPYQRLDFVETPTHDVLLGLVDPAGRMVDARLLSDGTLRCLAVLTALETVKEGSRAVIEEFDNGLHPSRVHVLTAALASCCKRRRLNVLVTTHNPATLDALQSEQLDAVVMCVWSKEAQAFDLVRLPDLPRYPELMERGCLGDLVTGRIIEQYLAPGIEEKRRGEALQWLDNLSRKRA